VGLEVGVERRVDDLGVALGELFVGDFGLLERFEVGVDRLRLGLGGRVEAVVDEFAEFAEVGGLLGQRRLEGVEVGELRPWSVRRWTRRANSMSQRRRRRR